VAIAVVLVVWGLMTHGTFAGSGDEPHYLIVAQSLAFDGDLDVANNYAQPGNLIGGGSLEVGTHARTGVDGVLRPAHDIGLPVLFVPVVRLAYPFAVAAAKIVPPRVLERMRLNDILIFRHAIGLCMALIAAALALQLLQVFRRSAPDGSAAAWALLITLSPPLLSHAFLFFTELPSAFLIVWVYREMTEEGGRPRWALIGLATGMLLFVHVRNIGAMAALMLWTIWMLRSSGSSRDWAAWLGFAAIPLAFRAAVMHRFWGTLLTSPLAAAGDVAQPAGGVVGEMLVRTSGLLFDQEFGLLVYAPIYLLALPGLWRLRDLGRGGAWTAAIAAAYVVPVLVPYINVHGWTGGWAPPARMITPVAPLLGMAAFACARSASGPARFIVLAVVSVQLVIDAIVWQWPKSLWNYEDGSSALLTSLPALSRLLPAWHGPAASVMPFLVCLAGWLLLTWALLRRPDARARVS
jgi:hypothetical protein